MDNKSTDKQSGVMLTGTVVSSTAALLTRRDDGKQTVKVSHEIALSPGLAVWEQFFAPNDSGIQIRGNEVSAFPKLAELKPITLKLKRFLKNKDTHLIIREAEVLA